MGLLFPKSCHATTFVLQLKTHGKMKKLLLLSFTLIGSVAIGLAQNVNIPDANLKAYLVGNTAINTNSDSEIQVSEAAAFTGQIWCDGKNIKDLTGIESFTNISFLNCSRNPIKRLDVSANTALTALNARNTEIDTIDISMNTGIREFYCYNNDSFVSLNVANGFAHLFRYFYAQNTANLDCITVDNVASCTSKWTFAKGNIDSTTGFSLDCNAPCRVEFLDTNFKAALLDHGVGITGTGISTIDLNNNGEIECTEAAAYSGKIKCSYKNINDLKGIEAFVNLTSLDCSNNSINAVNALDLSSNLKLTSLDYSKNYSSRLDVSANVALKSLTLHSNNMTTLDITKNTALTYLSANNNKLTSIDLSNNPLITRIYISSNSLTSIDLSNQADLYDITCEINKLTSLDVSKNTKLASLHCSRNLISSLDVSSNPLLFTLNCHTNSLTSLDLSKNTLIKNLQTYSNDIETLDLSTLGVLEFFEAQNSKLTSLNLANGNNTKVYVYNTQNNPDLKCIQVDDTAFAINNFTKIDTASNFSLNCSGNTSIKNLIYEQITIYPNPTHGKITMESNNKNTQNIKVLNLMGATLLEFSGNKNNIDVSSLTNGIYLLQVYYSNSIGFSQFIKE